MSALFLYLGGSLVFLAGALHTHAPVEYVVGSTLFTLGSLAALYSELRRK